MMLVLLGYQLPTEAFLTSICACVHARVCVCVCVCVYVCMYVCMYVLMCGVLNTYL